METGQKKKVYQLQLNGIKQSDDPTRLECTFIIIDFEVSHNGSIIHKEDALNSLAPTILNKPIVTKYVRVDEPNDNTDHLEGHNPYLSESRDGELQIEMDTTPIGVFVSEGYVLTIEGKEVLVADAILWKDRFPDACDLLVEWYDRGININTSCEILYRNFSFNDGVERILSPIYFSGHCILNSEKRGNQGVVLPAYDSSKLLSFNEINKFNRLVAQAIDQQSKEVEKVEERELNQEEVVEEVKEEPVVEQVEESAEEVVEEVEQQEETVEEPTEEPTEEVVEENEEVKTLQNQVKELQDKLSEATEKLVQLNSMVEELKPFKEQMEQEQVKKALNEKKDFYSAKFKALNAAEKFESEEVQELIKKSINESEEGKMAILQLNSMLVDMVIVEKEVTKEDTVIREVSSKRENLIPTSNDDFESRFSL